MASIAGLESFLAVARTGNLTEAARELHVTQPGLTARLQRLEGELGTELLVRLPRGVRLTAAGRTLLPYAERALESLDQGAAAVRDLARGTGGRIEIGAAPAVSTYVLPRALQRFAAEHPAVALGVRTGHSEELLELVLSEQIHADVLAARPLAAGCRGRVRAMLERHDLGGVHELLPPGGSGVGAQRGGRQGHDLKVGQDET